MVSEWREVVANGQGSRASADECDLFAVLLGRFWKSSRYVRFVVRRDSFEATDGHWLALDARSAAGGFAWPVAGAAKDSGEDVGFPIDHVGVVVSPLGDKADVFGHIGVGRACPLAIYDLVKVVGIANIGRLHSRLIIGYLSPFPW